MRYGLLALTFLMFALCACSANLSGSSSLGTGLVEQDWDTELGKRISTLRDRDFSVDKSSVDTGLPYIYVSLFADKTKENFDISVLKSIIERKLVDTGKFRPTTWSSSSFDLFLGSMPTDQVDNKRIAKESRKGKFRFVAFGNIRVMKFKGEKKQYILEINIVDAVTEQRPFSVFVPITEKLVTKP